MSNGINKQRVRCSLCDSLLKASTSHRYLLMGKSIHDKLNKNITYEECCQRYLNETYESSKSHMICPKCCHDLQHVYSLHNDAEELTAKIRHTWSKTKRLNRARQPRHVLSRNNENDSSPPLPTIATDDNMTITIKEELEIDQIPLKLNTSMDQLPIIVSESVLANTPYDFSDAHRIHNNSFSLKIPHQPFNTDNNGKSKTPKPKPRVSLLEIYF
jgi:hypothetical protein